MKTTTFLVIFLCSNLVLTISFKIINDSKLIELQEYDNTAGERRIVGGENVTNISQYPYMAAWLYLKYINETHKVLDSILCTGSILTPTVILTAAHCVSPNMDHINMTLIITGTVDWRHPGQWSRLKTIYVHPQFNITLFLKICHYEYDIAVLELEEPLVFNENVSAVKLPAPAELGDDLPLTAGGKRCTVLGWGVVEIVKGKSDVEEITSPFLSKADNDLISSAECDSLWLDSDSQLCEDSQFCTRDASGATGPCFGDSGGPLVCDGLSVGVLSFSNIYSADTACNGPYTTNIYTRVDVFMGFIEGIISRCSSLTPAIANLIIIFDLFLLKLR